MDKDTSDNELFVYSTRSGKKVLDSDILFNTPPPKESNVNDGSSCRPNLISFCGAVQALRLDFLPIHWQPQSGLVGRGGTSQVHQSLLSLELSLAFKVIDVGDVSRSRSVSEEERIYSLLLAEIQQMGQKPILNSPYIHKVEGLCFGLNKVTGTADQVLVFEKARHGDMHQFMTRGKGKSLSLPERLRMCRDVALGLETLHECNIIHGDFKPQNVLLMDFDGSIVPQVADFGYSIAYTNSESTIVVSRTVPWNAPEVDANSKTYAPIDAIRTDTFSFGMFCLWVLFREQVASHFGVSQDFADECKPSESPSFGIISNLKAQDQLRPLCKTLIQSLQMAPSQKESLEQFFVATLSPQPSERTVSFKLLCKCLDTTLGGESCYKAIQTVGFVGEMTVHGTPGQHVDFQISESALQLLRCDIRLREYITRSLFDQARQARCLSCRSNAAFQLSVCLSIGFGVAANDTSALEWLTRSERSQPELDKEVARMAQWSQASEPWVYHTNYLNNLSNEGYLHNIDYFGIYTADLPWENIKESYQREIADLEIRLGPQSVFSLFLRSVYALLVRNAGHYQEASSIQEDILYYFQSNPEFGNYLDTQTLMTELTESYRLQGNYEKAMQYCENVLAERTAVFEQENPQTLRCLHLKARLLQEMGSHQEAEMMYKSLLDQHQSSLGNHHVATVNVMSDLASLYVIQKRYGEALTLVEEELKLTEHLFGPFHYSILTTINNLGTVHFEMGDISRAQSLLDLALFRLRLALGSEHPSTCMILANCGSLYRKLEKYKESLDCYDEALINMENFWVLDIHVHWKSSWQRQRFLLRPKATSTRSPDCSKDAFKAEIKLLLHHAERSRRSLLSRQESHLGAHHVALIPTLSQLGEVLSQLDCEDAGKMYKRALDLASEREGEEELIWTCMGNLAAYLHDVGHDLQEAERLYRLIIDCKRASSSEQELDSGEDLDNLMKVLFDQGKFSEAEKTQRELMILTQDLLHPDYDSRTEQMTTLALILCNQGKYSEAETCYLEAIEISVKAAGDENTTLDLSAKLAWTMERGGKSEKALLFALEALQESKARYGKSHPVHLRVKSLTAAIHFRQGDRAEAIELNDEVVKDGLAVFGAHSEEMQAAEANQTIYVGAS